MSERKSVTRETLAAAMDAVDPPITGDEYDEDRAEHQAYANDIFDALPATPPASETVDALLNSLGIVGPNIRHAEQGMWPDGKVSANDTWDGPGWCVCGRRWPCEALALQAAIRAESEGLSCLLDCDCHSDPELDHGSCDNCTGKSEQARTESDERVAALRERFERNLRDGRLRPYDLILGAFDAALADADPEDADD